MVIVGAGVIGCATALEMTRRGHSVTVVDKLPAAAEVIFNTASHHRVHHGTNPQYLDRNYAGILIVWDRLFRTFEPEGERVRYGLTKNIATHNPIKIAFHEWSTMLGDVRSAPDWRPGCIREIPWKN